MIHLPIDDNPNMIIEAYKAEVDEHLRLTAVRFILKDLGFIGCAMLRDQDSCLEAVKRMRSIPY